jgi:BMFP domain-containing protein YqiC
MPDPKDLERLAQQLSRLLPPGLRGARNELEQNIRALLRAQFERLDLVSRERFDAQAELLQRTRARLAALEARLAALEDSGGTRRRAPQKSARNDGDGPKEG